MDDQPKPLQISDLMAERQSIRAYVRAKLLPVEELSKLAVAFLEQDISDPELEAVSKEDPDIFVTRANQFGVELFGIKAYSYAMVVFGDLLSKAEDFIKTTGKVRALSALKVNLGISLISCGNFDAGVSILLEAATIDEMNRYQTAPETSEHWRSAHPGQSDISAKDTDHDIVGKCQNLLSLPESSYDEHLTKVSLLSVFARNLAAHYLELPTGWTAELVEQIIQYQFLAQLLIFDWAYREGHFTVLNAPGVWPK